MIRNAPWACVGSWVARWGLPDLHVFAQNARPGFSGEHVAELIHGAELGAAARRGARVAALVQNEILDPAVEGVADSDALLESRIVHVVRLGVEDVDEVFVVYRKCYSAWHTELVPGR